MSALTRLVSLVLCLGSLVSCARGQNTMGGTSTGGGTGTTNSGPATCGVSGDTAVHTPPNYTTLGAPTKGMYYDDPQYKCKIARLTDGQADYAQAMHHEYALRSPFNANNTRMLLVREDAFWVITDLFGVVKIGPFAGAAYNPVWSRTDPNVYYHYTFGSNAYKKADITTGSIVDSNVATFSEYSSIKDPGGTADIGFDNDTVMIDGIRTGDSHHEICFFTISTATKGDCFDEGAAPAYDFWQVTPDGQAIRASGGLGSQLFDRSFSNLGSVSRNGTQATTDIAVDVGGDPVAHADVSAGSLIHVTGVTDSSFNGRWTVTSTSGYTITGPPVIHGLHVFWNDTAATASSSGGTMSTISAISTLNTTDNHQDVGKDAGGTSYLVVLGNNTACAGTGGVASIRISDGVQTCVFPIPAGTTWFDGHVAFGNTKGWILISYGAAYQSGAPDGTGLFSLPGNWATLWTAYEHELIAVNLDGRIIRLAHHRSRDQEYYYAQPKGVYSRDLSKVAFDSTFFSCPILDCSDVFVLDLGKALQ